MSFNVTGQEKGTVFVYRSKETSGTYPKTKTAIFCNGIKIAEPGNNRIFAIQLNPGKYMFRARDKKEPGIEFQVEAAKPYYVRGDGPDPNKVVSKAELSPLVN